jgi:hypothetical protein
MDKLRNLWKYFQITGNGYGIISYKQGDILFHVVKDRRYSRWFEEASLMDGWRRGHLSSVLCKFAFIHPVLLYGAYFCFYPAYLHFLYVLLSCCSVIGVMDFLNGLHILFHCPYHAVHGIAFSGLAARGGGLSVAIKKWGWRKTAFRALVIRSPKRWLEPRGAALMEAATRQMAAASWVVLLPLQNILENNRALSRDLWNIHVNRVRFLKNGRPQKQNRPFEKPCRVAR